VCAQGDAIPSLVRTLADADGVPLGQVRSRKGSVWVLSFRADRLVDASYLADLEPPIPRDPPAAEGQFGGP
jgi:8-oxo-dGTP diphosphatase